MKPSGLWSPIWVEENLQSHFKKPKHRISVVAVIRWVCTAILIYWSYQETGLATAACLVLMTITIELLIFRTTTRNK